MRILLIHGYVVGVVIAIVLLVVAYVIFALFPVLAALSGFMFDGLRVLFTVYVLLAIVSAIVAAIAAQWPATLPVLSVLVFFGVFLPIVVVFLNVTIALLLLAAIVGFIYFFQTLPRGIVTLIAYLAGATTSYGDPSPDRGPERFARGVNVGLNAVYSAVLMYLIWVPLLLLIPQAGPAIVLYCVLWSLAWPPYALWNSTSPTVKLVLAITNWVNPTSWLSQAQGILIFLGAVSLHWVGLALAAAGISTGLIVSRVSIRNAFVVTVGGLPWEIALWGGGFSEGSFSFWRPPGTSPGTEEHEAGHGLNLALFGGWFSNIGGIDEQLRKLDDDRTGRAGTTAATSVWAYSERLAEDNVPPSAVTVRQWPTVSIWR